MARPPRTHRIALITYSGKPTLTADDQLLSDALTEQGARVEAQPWDGSADWPTYDSIVLRSCAA
jgi:hypothetical protein